MSAPKRIIIREHIISVEEHQEFGMFGGYPAAEVKVKRLVRTSTRIRPLMGDDYTQSETSEVEERLFVTGYEVGQWKTKLAEQNAPKPCPHCGQPWVKKDS